jgi:drug/metabolite transporter (DMT)-like permease
MTTPEPKSPRKRKTKAERDAELAAQMAEEAAKPIDPLIWLILGGLLLVIGGFIYLDPMSFAEAGQASDNSFLRILFVMLVGVFGKNPTAIILSVLGLLSLLWGIRGWLREKSGANKEA